MKVERRRVTRVTTFFGKSSDLRSYTDARSLVDWLNEPNPDLKPHQEKAARAIDVLRKLNSTPAKEIRQGSPRVKQLREELELVIQPLLHLQWRIIPDIAGRLYLNQIDRGDVNYGLLLIARLSEHGLNWVCECPCGKWFIGRSGPTRFHSKECRLAFWKDALKTPEGREHRRLYMQKLRATKAKMKSKRREKR
jgi:hypothetical protein